MRKAEQCKKAGWRKEPVEDLSPSTMLRAVFGVKKSIEQEHRKQKQLNKLFAVQYEGLNGTIPFLRVPVSSHTHLTHSSRLKTWLAIFSNIY